MGEEEFFKYILFYCNTTKCKAVAKEQCGNALSSASQDTLKKWGFQFQKDTYTVASFLIEVEGGAEAAELEEARTRKAEILNCGHYREARKAMGIRRRRLASKRLEQRLNQAL